MAKRGATSEHPEVEALLASLRESIESGERHWFVAVLDGVGRWPLAEEEVDGRAYRYLVGGEAFDWLLLAERLCSSLADLIPQEELTPLLSHGRFPAEVTEEEFQQLLGGPKHRAHLNFFYGVQVEEALQLGVGQEVEKEQRCRVWENGHVDDEVCSRIYGTTRDELLRQFREKNGVQNGTFSLADLHEFTYWLFKHRVHNADPARVASDTRKGLATLARVRASASRLRELAI